MISDARFIKFPVIKDHRGNLSFIEANEHVPYDIKRVYYLYDVPGGALRGGHAHKKLRQTIISISGSFTISLDDGNEKKEYVLNSASEGLYLPTFVWREIYNFSSGAVCLVLASEAYDEDDYFREYSDFLDALKVKNGDDPVS